MPLIWDIVAHPKGTPIFRAASEYGLFVSQEAARAYIAANLSHIESVDFFPAMNHTQYKFHSAK